MENVNPQQKTFLLEPGFRSSFNYRAGDLTTTKSAFYEVDMEAQDAAFKYRSQSQKKLLANGAVDKDRKRRRVCTACCCHIFFLTLILILVAGVVVIKLVPKDPRISLGELRLTEFTYNSSSFLPGLPQVEVSLDAELNVTNRNRYADATYREIRLNLAYRDASLGEIDLHSFEQKKKTTTSLTVNLEKQETVIQSQADANSLKTEVVASNVQLQMTGKVKGTQKILNLKVRRFDIEIRCVINVMPRSESRQPQELSHSCYYDS